MKSLPDSSDKYAISFDGIKISYNIYTVDASSRWLIFLHGLGGDLNAWNEERVALQNLGYSTVAIDLRGHGLSDRPRYEGAYDISHFAHDILAVLKTENIENPILVGHCFGAMVTLYLEAYYPHTSSAIVLIDTSYKPPLFGKIVADHRILNSIISLVARHGPDAHKAEHVNAAQFKGLSEFSTKRIFSDVLHTSLKSYFAVSQYIIHMDLRTLLKKILVPSLIISGTDDLIFPPELEDDLRRRLHTKYIDYINGGNHMVVINNPEDVAIDIKKFLNKLRY